MKTIRYDERGEWKNELQTINELRTLDKSFSVELNGSAQRVRVCAQDAAAPPVIVVQGGPGYPILHEVKKFQRRLALESRLSVCYWDQRGCGPAAKNDVESVTFQQQIDDLRGLIRWVRVNSREKVTLLGISFGATISLLAAEYEQDNLKSVIAISPDINIAEMDASVAEFLRNKVAASSSRFKAMLTKLGDPPYNDPAKLQLRARLLADSGAIENSRSFTSLATELLVGLIRTYGPIGAIRSLRNMNAVQSRLLPEVNALNALTELPSFDIPIHCIVGGRDPIVPASARQSLSKVPGYSLTEIPEAGHMAHFDSPEIVRPIVERAAGLDPGSSQVQ